MASVLIAIGAPTAYAGTTLGCEFIPSMCPTQGGGGSGGGNSVPEPGTLGLLAMGAAASIGMLRRKKR